MPVHHARLHDPHHRAPGGIPFGVALGLPYELAFPSAVIGNISARALYYLVYIRRIFSLHA